MGFAVVGSTVSSYIIKESIFEIFQHLQFVPRYTSVSLTGVAEIVNKIYQKATRDLGAILFKNGLCQLLLAGLCPESFSLRIFLFDFDCDNFPIQCSYREILTAEEIVFLGSGRNIANDIHVKEPNLNSLQIIRRIIHSNADPSVGGGLQYGEFNSYGNFEVYGVQDYAVDEKGNFKEYINTLRGINWHKDDFERDSSEFHISLTYLMPFEDEINEIWRRQYGI